MRRGKASDFWLVEGARATVEALQRGQRPAAILADPERISEGEFNRLEELAPRVVQPASGGLLDEVADQDSPRGLLALFPRSPPLWPAAPAPGLYLFADRIQDPRNLGALVRVALAFGARSLFASAGCCAANHPRVVRSSAGLAIDAPLFERQDLAGALARLGSLEPLVAALDPGGSSRLPEIRFPETVLLLIGTEGQGLGDGLREAAAVTLSIPMSAEVESLNLATAAAVACYEFARQRSAF